MVNCHTVFVKLHGGETLTFTNDTPVLEILKTCASCLDISAHYITRFTIQTESGLLLPYRKSIPANADGFALFAFDDLPLDEMLHNNVQCFLYYFSQCKDQFLNGDHSTCDVNNETSMLLHRELFLVFVRMNGLSLKRPEVGKTLRKYTTIFKICLADERSFLMNITNTELEKCSAKQHMLNFIENYKLHALLGMKRFTRFVGIEVAFEKQPVFLSEVLVSETSVEIVSLPKTLKLQDISAISSHRSLKVDLSMANGSHCILHLPSFILYETFLTVLDHYVRLQNQDTSSPLSSITDIPTEFCVKDNNGFKWLKQPIIPFDDISSKEVKLALEIYGKSSGLYGLIKNDHLFKLRKGTIYILIYCVENSVCEKIICCKEGMYHFENSPHLRYTSIPALIRLCRLGLSSSPCKTYLLTKQINDSLLSDIQYPEVRDIIVSQSDLSALYLAQETWLATIYRGKLTTKQRMITHFVYNSMLISDKARKAVFSEASVLAKVESENVLQILHLCVSLDSTAIKYITEDIPFYTLHEHLKTEYIPTYARLDMNIRISEDCTEGPMAFTLLFKYVRDIVAGLQFLHSHNIVHTLPAPQHILLDQVSNKLKLFDAGVFGKVFTSSSHPRLIIQQSENFEVSVLRWMSESSIFKSEVLNSTYQDRWVFGVTVWQIFNNGSIPLGKHSNEELLNRYLKIKEQQNCLDGNIPIEGWFPLKLDIPKQDDLTVNKKIQKLVNYTITDHLNDQEDAFEEIADLFNNDVFPLDRSVNIYEKLEKNTEMKIERKDGKLYFKRQQITALSQPVYSQSIEPVYYDDINVFDIQTECSDGSDYSSSIDCENVDPETDFSNSGPVPDWYHQATNSDAFNFSDNYDNGDPFCNDELSFTLLQECELQNQLHRFNNKKWESSFYKLGETVGAGNFGVVRKAVVQINDRIPPELRRREIAVKIFSLPAAHDDAIETIVQEAENMLRLEHDRIVPLYGISSSLENKEIHIIMPFYQLGSLTSYIRQFHNELKENGLCLFGLQIAEGMEYLNSKGFVHRDLALRNILVDTHKNVRIADLGLTRGVVKDQDYYYFANKSIKAGLPTLWYPPEFFNKSKYDKYCDVWSYGVTMFEMWSYGETPYKRYGVHKQTELIDFLKRSTLGIPKDTPRIFEHVMKRCWKEKKVRWDFTAIVNFIKCNLSAPRYPVGNEDTYICTRSRQCGGYFATQKVLVKEINGLKILKPFNFTEATKDVENRDPEIQYNELTVRRYVTSLPEEYVRRILSIKHRHMMQYVGYVYTDGLLYTAAPVHSIGTLHHRCANAKADLFTKKIGYAAQVLQGMLYLLSQNIPHGSLSIHNVWFRDNNCAVISEAGMVQTMRLDKLTPLNVITYPPEVLENVLEDQEVTLETRTDTWMFGVMLLHMFSHEPPYSEVGPPNDEGGTETIKEVCGAICNVLKKNVSALCAETIKPAEIKRALSLCFTELNSRGDISVLKPCFQV